MLKDFGHQMKVLWYNIYNNGGYLMSDLEKQKQNYETQFKQAETRLQQLAEESQRLTVQREQLRGAIYALEQVMQSLTPPVTTPTVEVKPLEVVKEEETTQEQVN